MDERFLRQWFSPRIVHTCLGRKLLPYSLSHHIVLEALDSPVLAGNKPVSVPDLLLAVRVCSTVQFPVEPTRTAYSVRDQFVRAALENNVRLRATHTGRFVAYLEEFACMPEFWEDAQSRDVDENLPKSRPLTGPYVLAQAVSVMQAFPQLSEERVWTMPMGLLAWYHGQAMELKGLRRFWNKEQEKEIEEGLQKAEAAITPEMREKAAKIKAAHEARQQANREKNNPLAKPGTGLWTPGMEVKGAFGVPFLPREVKPPTSMPKPERKEDHGAS